MRLRKPLASLAFMLLVVPPVLLSAPDASAQLPQLNQDSKLPQLDQQSTDEKEKARKELEKRALQLLDDTLQSAQALRLAENRAVIRAQAADLLWKRDEKRARTLFRDAVMELVAARGEAAKDDRAVWMLAELRPRLLYMIAGRDPQLALDLLRESRPAASEGAAQGAWAGNEQEQSLEQAIAAKAAESDPKLALKMAEEGLEKGVNLNVLNVLERLREKDSEAAKRLAGEVVGKLRDEGLSAGRETNFVAVSLLSSALSPQSPRLFASGPASPARDAEKPKPLALEDGDLRDLAELVTSAALRDSNASGAFGLTMQIRPLLPELERLVPARAAQLRQRIAEMDKALDPRMRSWAQFNSVVSGASADSILEAAAEAPPEMRQSYYSLAAMKLAESGDTERARQVVSDNMTGQEREQMLAQVDGAAVARDVEKGKLEEARAVVSGIKSKERRAGALAELATAFAAKGDKKGAAQLLEEARALVNRQPENEREMGALLEVARGYALVEPSKTFEMIDPLVDQANDMVAAAALLEKFGAGQGFFRKGEMILSPGMANLNGMYARYVKALAELARVDFDRTRSDADRFRHEEVRLMARLVIAQSVLSDHLGAGAGGYVEGFAYGGGTIYISH